MCNCANTIEHALNTFCVTTAANKHVDVAKNAQHTKNMHVLMLADKTRHCYAEHDSLMCVSHGGRLNDNTQSKYFALKPTTHLSITILPQVAPNDARPSANLNAEIDAAHLNQPFDFASQRWLDT